MEKEKCGIEATVIVDGKAVVLRLGVIEQNDWRSDNDKRETKFAWIEVGGDRYMTSSFYSGGTTGFGFNGNLYDLYDDLKDYDPKRVITRDPMVAFEYMEAKELAEERLQEELKQKRFKAVGEINRVIPEKTKVCEINGFAYFVKRDQAMYIPGHNNRIQCRVYSIRVQAFPLISRIELKNPTVYSQEEEKIFLSDYFTLPNKFKKKKWYDAFGNHSLYITLKDAENKMRGEIEDIKRSLMGKKSYLL